jgi:hypothetical protein
VLNNSKKFWMKSGCKISLQRQYLFMGYMLLSKQTQHTFHQASGFKRYKMKNIKYSVLLSSAEESLCKGNFVNLLCWYAGRLAELLFIIKFPVFLVLSSAKCCYHHCKSLLFKIQDHIPISLCLTCCIPCSVNSTWFTEHK